MTDPKPKRTRRKSAVADNAMNASANTTSDNSDNSNSSDNGDNGDNGGTKNDGNNADSRATGADTASREEPMLAIQQSSEIILGDGLEAEIQRRAYEIYLARGGVGGDDVSDWLEAERLVRSRRPSDADGNSGRSDRL